MKEEKLRLNKYIANCGVCSRRKADELIEAGHISVNGKIVKELGTIISSKDKIMLDKDLITEDKLIYIRYYKPAGYITTTSDEKGRKTIYDILPDEVKKLKPVGRLDKDSTGLLIMTNDGSLINQLTHPSLKIPKVYRVAAEGKLNVKDLDMMANGIEIEPGKIAYAESSIVDFEGKNTVLEVILHQGLNRQIRRMLDYLGHPVISLKRVSCVNINLEGMKKGQFKYIKPKQIEDLKRYLKKLVE